MASSGTTASAGKPTSSSSSSELRQQALLMLFVRLLQDSLISDADQPATAGFMFDVGNTDSGFELRITGFPQKLLPFVSMVVSRVCTLLPFFFANAKQWLGGCG